MPIELIESHSLLPHLIRCGGLVVDCGANVGAFSRVIVERFGCRVLAYEASPEAFSRIPKFSHMRKQNVAVNGTDGPVTIALDEDATRSSIVEKRKDGRRGVVVPGRRLADLLAEAGEEGEIEVLKLDIEGAELAVIDSLSDDLIHRMCQVTIEFHDFLGYYSASEAVKRIDRISALGFRELFWSRTRNTGDVLLVNSERLGRWRHGIEQQVVRPLRAASRLMVRNLK